MPARGPVLALALGLTALVALGGCSESEQITRYTIPNESTAGDTAGQSTGMLAALVPHEGRAWFFKVTGPAAAVRRQADAFRDFVRSLTFAEGQPQWTLPAGWQEQPGDGAMRMATVQLSSNPPLEMSVIPLAIPPGDPTDYVLSNVNRWRNQLQLAPISAGALPEQTEQIALSEGTTATLVDLVGTAASDGMTSGAPFARGAAPFAGSGAPLAGGPAGLRGSGDQPPALEYEKPENWEPGQQVVSRSGITIRREAAFNISSGDQQAEVTVTTLPGSADLLANVNRWRRQVGLSPIDQQQAEAESQTVDVAGTPGNYVQFRGPQETILAVTVVQPDRSWFIKLQGPHELVAQEKEHFEQFVESVQFGSAEGAELNGQQ